MIRLLFILLVCVFNIGWTVDGGWDNGLNPASKVNTDTTNFDNNLSSLDDTVQKALETLDALSIVASINWTDIGGLQSDINVGGFTNNVGYLTGVTVNAPLSGSGTAASHLLIPQATGSVDGYLYQQDWTTFNGKQANLGLVAGTMTDGKYCTYTSSGTIIACNSTPTAISGLTTGYIPKASSATAIVDSAIYENGGFVGIGTTAPSVPLMVVPSGAYSWGTGGDTITNYDAGAGVYYRIHKFTTTGAGTFVAPSGLSGTVEVLVVAGGGAGSETGGGAGGVVMHNSYAVTNAQSIGLSVGTGGTAYTQATGSSGGNSTFGTITANGGAGSVYRAAGVAGGSTAGGHGWAAHVAHNQGDSGGGTGYGNDGGDGGVCGWGGGGGAGAVGQTCPTTAGSNGGIGISSSITGTPVYYAGGGGSPHSTSGGTVNGTGGATGAGNGGFDANGGDATANTGSAGGGGYGGGRRGGHGGSGVVIVRYVIPSLVAPAGLPQAVTINGNTTIGKLTNATGSLDIQGYGTTTNPTFVTSDSAAKPLISALDNGSITLTGHTTALGFLKTQQASGDADSYDHIFQKTRGTIASPTVITTADELGTIQFQGYSGAGGYVTGAAIKAISEGTIATTRVPGTLSLWTGTDAAPTALTQRLKIDSAGLWTLFDGTTINTGATTGTKIGTATTQKLGFYNATPIVQPLATAEIGLALSNLGLRAAGTAYPITTSGAVTLGSLTATRVPFAGTAGLLSDDADMTFATDTLTATKIVAPTSILVGASGTASDTLDVHGGATGGVTVDSISAFTSHYPPVQNSTYVKATTYLADYNPEYATNPAKSLTGGASTNSWAANLVTTNQRFHIDLGSGYVVTRVYYENWHTSGGATERGVKNFTMWGSNDSSAFATLTYGTDTNWTQLTTSISQMVKHVASDVADAKYITVTNSTSYRYYAFKCADNWGDGTTIGVRRIELQTSSSNPAVKLSGNSTQKAKMWTDGDDADKFKIDMVSATKMTIDTTGNVGIGVTAPTQKLDVDGIIYGRTGVYAGDSTNQIQLSANPTVYLGTARPRRSFFVSSTGMIPATTDGSGALTQTETATNKVNYYSSTFSGSADKNIQFTTPLPKSWDGGTITALLYYIPTGTTDGTGIKWTISGVLVGDNVTPDTAFGTPVTITDTIQTANNLHTTPESGAVTIDGSLYGDKIIFWKITRDSTDTNSDDAQLVGALLKYTSTTETDN